MFSSPLTKIYHTTLFGKDKLINLCRDVRRKEF